MRILITGANGQLGRGLQRTFAAEHDVDAPGRPELDITNRASTEARFAATRPQIVVHCAALTNTAICEREPPRADLTNAQGTGVVAEAAEAAGAKLIVVSTNEVFDNARKPIAEDTRPQPLNKYGDSKCIGEDLARVECESTPLLIVRTAWLYGEGSSNFVAKVLAAARAGKPLRFVTDEIATPTYVDDLAIAIRQLIEREAASGIYHLTNEGEASRYEWACEILRLAGKGDVPVEPITTQELYASGYDGPRKPRYSVLANTRARVLGITMRDWREALADYFAKSRVAADA